MSKSRVFLILFLSLFISLISLIALSYGATASGKVPRNIFEVITENQLTAGLAAAAIGSLLTALIVFLIEDNRDKRKAAVGLLEEFTSFNFLETRNKAGLVFKEHLHNPIKSLDDLYFALKNENWRYVSHIEHFFKKVDKLVALRELDTSYIKAFLDGEFSHWYNSYFFPACLADLSRKHRSEATIKGVNPANLLDLSGNTGLPLKEVDYASAFGMNRPEHQIENNRLEVSSMIRHIEELVNAGVIDKSVFHWTEKWSESGIGDKGNFISFYDGTGLPFPHLRKLFR